MSNFRIDVIPFTELRLADAVLRDVRHMIKNGGEAPRLDESALTGVESELNRMLQFVIVSFIEEGFSSVAPVSADAAATDPWVGKAGDFTVQDNGYMRVVVTHPLSLQWPHNIHISWAVVAEACGELEEEPASLPERLRKKPVTCNVRVGSSGTYTEYPCVVPEGRSTLMGSAVIPARPKGLNAVTFALWAQNGSIYVPAGRCEVTVYTTPSTGAAT